MTCLNNSRRIKRIEMIGPLGVGKTTLLNACKSSLSVKSVSLIFENINRITQEIAYWNEDKNSRSFFMQSVYYWETFKNLCISDGRSNLLLSDSSFLFHHFGYTNLLFEQGMINALEHKYLADIHTSLSLQLPQLAGVIHCHADPSTILARIINRDRDMEFSINENLVLSLIAASNNLVSSLNVETLDINLESIAPQEAAGKIGTFLDIWLGQEVSS